MPLGVYRLPLQVEREKVELRTVIARIDDDELVLFDASRNRELARGVAEPSWDGTATPYHFGSPGGFPLTLFVRDGVIEDTNERPWAKAAAQPLVRGADRVRLVTFASGSVKRTFVLAGRTLYAERAEEQPALDATPNPLEILSSVAGTGLSLQVSGELQEEWRDPMTVAVPPTPAMPVACGAPLVSLSRVKAVETLRLPAGELEALPIVEIIDACKQAVTPELRLYQYERHFVRGVGPVKLAYSPSDSRRRQYLLTSHAVTGGADDLWPIAQGNRWTFEVRGGDGAVAGPPVEVRIEKVTEVVAQ